MASQAEDDPEPTVEPQLETKGEKGPDACRAKRIRQLFDLAKTLEPFVDTCGVTHCHLPMADGRWATWRLRDEPVMNLLAYRFSEKNGHIPTRSDIVEALRLVEGELWDSGKVVVAPTVDATMTAITAAFAQTESWIGRSSDLLTLLQNVAHNSADLRSENLPKSPDALGIWLTKNTLALRERDLDFSRPTRTREKRLWTMQRLPAQNDTSPTIPAEVSDEASLGKAQQDNNMRHDDACDTYTEDEEEILAVYQGEQNNER
jgi:hypothetical protein